MFYFGTFSPIFSVRVKIWYNARNAHLESIILNTIFFPLYLPNLDPERKKGKKNLETESTSQPYFVCNKCLSS